MANQTSINLCPSLASILTVIFVIAKIMGKIDWSWWWVFSPLWLTVALVLAIFVVIGILYCGAWILDKICGR